MADRRTRWAQLWKPYPGEPPVGLHGADRPDLFTRTAGMAISHFVSVIMRLGGDQPPADLPEVLDRRRVRVADRRLVARDADVVQLTLVDPDGGPLPSWHPGAHIEVHLPSGRRRQYSLCGDPRDADYRIAVRRIADGGGGSIEVHDLAAGQLLDIGAPRNAFLMPVPGSGSPARNLRIVVGGIGITPILPMVRLAEQLEIPWTCLYAGRSRDSLPFLDELGAFGDKVTVRTDDSQGIPTAAELLEGVGQDSAVYICGPPAMIETVRRSIPVDSGIELHIERFTPLPVVDGLPFEIELSRTAEIVQVGPSQTALSALRAVRPNVSYSCQQGFCGTCVQHVLEGSVEHRDRRLTATQRQAGQMLVCVSRADRSATRLVLDI